MNNLRFISSSSWITTYVYLRQLGWIWDGSLWSTLPWVCWSMFDVIALPTQSWIDLFSLTITGIAIWLLPFTFPLATWCELFWLESCGGGGGGWFKDTFFSVNCYEQINTFDRILLTPNINTNPCILQNTCFIICFS